MTPKGPTRKESGYHRPQDSRDSGSGSSRVGHHGRREVQARQPNIQRLRRDNPGNTNPPEAHRQTLSTRRFAGRSQTDRSSGPASSDARPTRDHRRTTSRIERPEGHNQTAKSTSRSHSQTPRIHQAHSMSEEGLKEHLIWFQDKMKQERWYEIGQQFQTLENNRVYFGSDEAKALDGLPHKSLKLYNQIRDIKISLILIKKYHPKKHDCKGNTSNSKWYKELPRNHKFANLNWQDFTKTVSLARAVLLNDTLIEQCSTDELVDRYKMAQEYLFWSLKSRVLPFYVHAA